MKKSRKILIYFFVFILFSTFNPNISNFSNLNLVSFFYIKKIKSVNDNIIFNTEIYPKLNKFHGTNIFLLKKDDVKKIIKNIETIENVRVRKKYPETILIDFETINPTAIFYAKGKKYFITTSNNIVKYNSDFDKNLPYIFGEKGEKFFLKFLQLLKENNFPIQLIKEFHFFKANRWDLHLLNDKIIRLPSFEVDKAIRRSIKLLEKDDFNKYRVLDFRINGKIITSNEL